MKHRTVVILVVIGCLVLAIGNLAFWLSTQVIDAQQFGNNVAHAIQSDAAAGAIASEIVDAVLEERPVIRELVRPQAEQAIVWIIQRPFLDTVIGGLAEAANLVMTRRVAESVGLDFDLKIEGETIQQVAGIVSSVVQLVAPELESQIQEELASIEIGGTTLEEGLTLVDSVQLPDLSPISSTVPWLWPLALLGVIALFGWALWAAEDRATALRDVGIGIIVTAAIITLFIPALRQVITVNIPDMLGRVIVGEAFSALSRWLFLQNLVLAALGLGGIMYSRSDDFARRFGGAEEAADAPEMAEAA